MAAMLLGTPRAFDPLHLDVAVSKLVTASNPGVIRALRLALTDLCRTRAAGPDPLVDAGLQRLADRVATLENMPPVKHDELVKYFTNDLFQHNPTDVEVYRDAVKYLAARFRPGNRTGIELLSWQEGLL
jgi:hypothetical protein